MNIFSLADITSNITPLNNIESNHKIIIATYLNKTMRGTDEFTTTQWDNIDSIANTCARLGGRSVNFARQLYLTNEYFDFDEDSICEYSEPEGIILHTEMYNASKEKLTIYPNPSNGNFIIEVKNGIIPLNSKLFIYDLKGREVLVKLVDKECKKIEINKADLGYVEGIFICKLISSGDVLYSPKIILHK